MVTPTNNDFTSQKIILSALCEVNLYLEKRILIPRKEYLCGILFFPSSVSISDSSSLLFLGFKRPVSALFRPGKPVITCTSHLMLSYQQAPLWVTVVNHCCETLKPTDGHTLTQQPWFKAGEGSPGPGLRSETPDWDGLQACYSSQDVIVIYDVSYWLSLMVHEGNIIQMFCW